MRRLAWFAGGFCVMTAFFVCGLPLVWCYVMAVAIAVTAWALMLWRAAGNVSRRLAAAALGLCLGFSWSWLDWQRNVRSLESFDGQTRTVEAMALSGPRRSDYSTSVSVVFTLEGKTCHAVLYGDPDLLLRPGDRITGPMRFRRTGAFSGEDSIYHAARGMDFQLFLCGQAKVTSPDSVPLRCLPAAFSEALKERLSLLLPGQACGFETALLTGDCSGLSDSLYDDMGLAGTRHVVAVSGMHVSILTGLLLLLLGNRRLTVFLVLPVLIFYGSCTGMTPSVTRALVMQSLLLLAPVFHRENDSPTALLTALMLILIPNPRAILDVGLQLSFASASGILLFSRRIFDVLWESRWCKRIRRGPRFLSGMVMTILSSVAASVSVIPLTMPLQLLYFESFSLVGPLSAVFLTPLLPLLLSLGVLALAISLLWFPLGQVLALPLLWLIRWCVGLNGWIASIPFAALSSRNLYLLIFLLGVYAMTVWRLLDSRRCSLWVCGACLAGLFSLCLLLSAMERDRAGLSAAMLDVGQGQCVCLQSGGYAALYDCGGDGDPAEAAVQFLQGSGRGSLDFLVLSHYDRDHSNGVVRLLQRIQVGAIYLPEQPDEEGVQMSILTAARERGCRVLFVTEDLSLPFGAGAARLYAPACAGTGNDSSVAALFGAGDFEILLTGDMGVTAEKKLIVGQNFHDVEVLVVGHHGAADSAGPATLHYLRPKLALISVGEGNGYGHPSRRTLARLGAAGVQVYRTDQCGDIMVWR